MAPPTPTPVQTDTRPIVVSIVEDDPGLRHAIASLIDMEPQMRIQETYAGAEDAVAPLLHMPPDVLLVDICLKQKDGV